MAKFMDWVIDNHKWLFSGAAVAVFLVVGRLIFNKIFGSNSQTIRTGDNSTNIQAGRDVNIGNKKKGNDVDEG